jgi:hypothetical protein
LISGNDESILAKSDNNNTNEITQNSKDATGKKSSLVHNKSTDKLT